MLSASQISFALFVLASFGHAQTGVNNSVVSFHHQNTPTAISQGFGTETRCSWNCTVVDSDLTEELKTIIAKRRLIRLAVKFEKKMDDKCVNQTSRNSSGNATEHWQIWLSNNVSSVANVMETLSNLISFLSSSNAERNEIRAVCTLQSSPTAATSHQKNTGVAIHDLKELFAGYPQPCNTERNIAQPCINVAKSTGNNTDDLDNPNEWQVVVLILFCIPALSLVYYAPAFLCFFSPTVVKENDVRQIILEGASPVSFRSLLGNYFFSGDDGTIWHKTRTFTLLVVVLPALFLPLAIALDKNYLKSYTGDEFDILPDIGFGALHLFHPFYLACYACYVFQAICLSFLTVKYFHGKTCTVCRHVQPDIYNCRDQKLPGQIIHHLRQQPLILLKCWRLFLRYLVNYFRICLSVVLPCQVSSVSSCLGICLFPIFLLLIPLVALMLLTALSLVALVSLFLTCPVSTICNVTRGRRFVYRLAVFKYTAKFLSFCCYPLTFIGAYIVLTFSAIAIMKSLLWAITQLCSEDSLPYLACFILVFYYVCSSYSSFTGKYQFLALTLYKHHKKSPAVTDQQETERYTLIPDTVMRIPKELFDEACERLMPIRVGVCILVLRLAVILAFIFLVFSLPMWYHVSVTPVTRALLMLLSGLLLKIIDIFISDGGQKNIETTAIDEKVSYIIEDYNNSRETEQSIEIVSTM